MTIGAIILDLLLIFGLILSVILIVINSFENGVRNGIAVAIIGVIIICIIVVIQLWYYSSTESGKRAMKTQKSNFNEGLKREIKVYSVDGKIIEKYNGKFDVDYDDNRVIFDDEKGNRHIIYYPTGTVIINEIGE